MPVYIINEHEVTDPVAFERYPALAALRSFAAKFAQLVGEPPLRYLTRLRLNAAGERLRSSDAKLSAIAAAVGYESVAAFVKAFKRYLGVTPGEYRRARPPGPLTLTSREPRNNPRSHGQR